MAASEWRQIPEWPRYEIDYLGRVRYVGTHEPLSWVKREGLRYYMLHQASEHVIHFHTMLSLVEKTFPELFTLERRN